MARFCIFVLAALLLLYSLYGAAERRLQRSSYKKLYSLILHSYKDKKTAGFHYALLTGDKGRLNRQTKKAFQKLFLLHFLTPSGLHLGFLISILCFFSRKLLWITPLLFLLDGFYAAKRVLCLFYLNRFHSNRMAIFFFFFTLDFFFGSFAKNPLSFSLSFLFLGIIYTNKSFHSLFFYFMGAQILVSFFFEQSFSLIGYTLGFLLTPLLAITFPLYLTGFHEVTKFLSSLTIGLIEYLAKFSDIDSMAMALNLVMALFLIISPWNIKGKMVLITLCLVTYSPTVINLKSYRHLYYDPTGIRQYESFKRTRTGYKVITGNQTFCYLRLRNFSYEIDCPSYSYFNN